MHFSTHIDAKINIELVEILRKTNFWKYWVLDRLCIQFKEGSIQNFLDFM